MELSCLETNDLKAKMFEYRAKQMLEVGVVL